MAFITAPDFKIVTIRWELSRPAQINRSDWTGRRTVVVNPWHAKWRAHVELAVQQGEENFRALRSFFARCRGSVNTFRLYATAGKQNDNFNVRVDTAAAQGATSLTLAGYDTALLDGQMVTVNGQLLQLTKAQSGATITFEPPLREAAAAGEPVATSRPYALVHMAQSSSAWGVEPWRRFTTSFDVEEAILEADGATADSDALHLDFANSLYFNGGTFSTSVSSLLGYTYTRTGAKGEINALTGTDRIDEFAADVPGIVPSLGYWSRDSLTNALLHSQAFDNAVWQKTELAVTANSVAAPDGTATAEKLIPSTTSSAHIVFQNSSITGGVAYTETYFVHKGTTPGYSWVQITGSSGFPQDWANINLADGSIGNSSLSTAIVDVTPLSDDWYRIRMTSTANATTASGRMVLAVLDSDQAARLPAFAGDGTSGIAVWQGQRIEDNLSDGGPVIATTTAAATVGADSLLCDVSTLEDDFIVEFTTGELPPGRSDFVRLYDTANTSNGPKVVRLSSTTWRIYGDGNVLLGSVAVPSSDATAACILRRRAGTYTLAVRQNGVTTVGGEMTAALQATLNRAAVGVWSERAKTRMKLLATRNGAFSNADIEARLLELNP